MHGIGSLRDPLRHAARDTSPASAGEASGRGWCLGERLRLALLGGSPVRAGEAAVDLGGGFADGLGVLGCFGLVFAEVGEAGEGEGLGLGLDELAACVVDGFDGLPGDPELFGVDDGGELGEVQVVVVAQVECADGGVEKVLEDVVGELGRGRG